MSPPDRSSPRPTPLSATELQQIGELCRRHRVRRLYIFGSAARDDFDPQRSDIDFAVEFEPEMPRRGFSDPFFSLLLDLEELLRRKVDLVEIGALRDPLFREELERTRVTIYER